MQKRKQLNYRVPNTYLRQFYRFLGNKDELLEGTSETQESLAQIGQTNSFSDYCQFFRNARKTTKDPSIGLLLGRVNQLSNIHGPLSTALYNSIDMRDCLQLLNRYMPLRNEAYQSKWVENNELFGIEIKCLDDTEDIHISVAETLLMSLNNIISVVSERDIHPYRIELDYPKPSYADKYPEAFEVEAILFSQPTIRVLLRKEQANVTTAVDDDPLLRTSAIDRMEQLLKGTARQISVSDKIRNIFSDNPGHLWTLKEISQHLNTSDRTLQRRLNDEHVTYQQLQHEWLKREARQLLREPQLSIESVAMLLGYSDVSNFRHACRRWYNQSPQALRQQLLTNLEHP